MSIDDNVVGFHVTVNETKYELVKNYTTWSAYIDDVERVIENSKNLIELVKEHKDGERHTSLSVDILKNEQQERYELNCLFGDVWCNPPYGA